MSASAPLPSLDRFFPQGTLGKAAPADRAALLQPQPRMNVESKLRLLGLDASSLGDVLRDPAGQLQDGSSRDPNHALCRIGASCA